MRGYQTAKQIELSIGGYTLQQITFHKETFQQFLFLFWGLIKFKKIIKVHLYETV